MILVDNVIKAIKLSQIGYDSSTLGNRLNEHKKQRILEISERYEDLFYFIDCNDEDLYQENNLTQLSKYLLSQGIFLKFNITNKSKNHLNPKEVSKLQSNAKSLLDYYIEQISSRNNNGRQAIDYIEEFIAPLLARIDSKYHGALIEDVRANLSNIRSCKKSSLKKSEVETMINEAKNKINDESDRPDWGTNSEFKPAILANYLSDNYYFISLGNKGNPDRFPLYIYKNGVYKSGGQQILDRVLQQENYLGDNWKKPNADEVSAYIKRGNTKTIEDVFSNKKRGNYINCKNGMLKIDDEKLLPHDPMYLSFNQLNAEYKPNIQCSIVDKAVEDILISNENSDESKVDIFWEFVGSAIYQGDVNPKKMLFLLGEGDNGKSVLLSMIVKFLGASNVSSLSLSAIAENNFAAANLFNKLANINGDLDSTDLQDSSLIKQLTGGDTINADRKYKEPLEFKNKASLIFAMNALPKVLDYSNAYFNRLLILETPNIFTPDTDNFDPDIVEKITNDKAKSHILNKAIDGLTRLKSNGWQFSESKKSNEILRDYKITCNHVEAFLEEACNGVPGGIVVKYKLYDLYKLWVSQNGFRQIASRTFYDRVRKSSVIKVKNSRKYINAKTQRVFENIEINEPIADQYGFNN